MRRIEKIPKERARKSKNREKGKKEKCKAE